MDVGLGPTIELMPNFELTPTLMVDLLFDQPVTINGQEVMEFTGLWDSLPDIALTGDEANITPEFCIDAILSNDTLLGLDGVFTIDALTASFSIGCCGVSIDVGTIGIGHIFEERGNLFDTLRPIQREFRFAGI